MLKPKVVNPIANKQKMKRYFCLLIKDLEKNAGTTIPVNNPPKAQGIKAQKTNATKPGIIM